MKANVKRTAIQLQLMVERNEVFGKQRRSSQQNSSSMCVYHAEFGVDVAAEGDEAVNALSDGLHATLL